MLGDLLPRSECLPVNVPPASCLRPLIKGSPLACTRRPDYSRAYANSLAHARVVVREGVEHMPQRVLPRLALHPRVVGERAGHVLRRAGRMGSTAKRVASAAVELPVSAGCAPTLRAPAHHLLLPLRPTLQMHPFSAPHPPVLSGAQTATPPPASPHPHSTLAGAAPASRWRRKAAATGFAAAQAVCPAGGAAGGRRVGAISTTGPLGY